MTWRIAGRCRRFLLPAAAMLVATVALGSTMETDIDQLGQRFNKGSLRVLRGTIVHFLNHDDVTHNIHVIDSSDQFVDEGLQKPGNNIDVLFDRTGQFTVRCNIHPRMKLVISVE